MGKNQRRYPTMCLGASSRVVKYTSSSVRGQVSSVATASNLVISLSSNSGGRVGKLRYSNRKILVTSKRILGARVT